MRYIVVRWSDKDPDLNLGIGMLVIKALPNKKEAWKFYAGLPRPCEECLKRIECLAGPELCYLNEIWKEVGNGIERVY